MKNPISSSDLPARERATRGALAQADSPMTEESAREEARRRIRSKPGFFASLSPEALEMIRTCDGPERLGDPGA